MNTYIGHSSQLSGVEEYTLSKGMGKGMSLLSVRNGKGLCFTLSADRCMDISRLFVNGINIGYFAPCGYVAPSYYDNADTGFLKSFTAGFMTTCGIYAVGSPCTDDGEALPLHGTIANKPCENYSYSENDNYITINADIREASLFSHQVLLHRIYSCSKKNNRLTVTDTVENIGSREEPCMILYHCNMGYPLLSEKAHVKIPSFDVKARNHHAETGIDKCLIIEKPQRGYEEMCFYHFGVKHAGIYNPDVNIGAVINIKSDTLNCFTQWKMMGEYEYVLGLEPGNCTPDGRDVMRNNNMLKTLLPGEKYTTQLEFIFTNNEEDFECLFH